MRLFIIQKADYRGAFDNGNYNPSDGGMYPANQAIATLENGNGGVMSEVDENGKILRNFLVNYDKKQNDWLKKELGV